MSQNVQFEWKGDEVAARRIQALNQAMVELGHFAVEHMVQHAPHDTYALIEQIHYEYDFSTHVLTVFSPAFYSVYQEFGTRNMHAHPFIRPTILDIGPEWYDMRLNWTIDIHPPMQHSEPLIATTSGFHVPRRQKLTAKQLAHVNTSLRPTSKRFAGQFKRRGIGFTVVGPKRRHG